MGLMAREGLYVFLVYITCEKYSVYIYVFRSCLESRSCWMNPT